MKLDIRKENDLVLRKPTEEIGDFGFEFQQLVENMIETMRAAKGIGLAAPQVGESKKVFVVEFDGDKENGLDGFPLTVICNPEITKASKNKINMVEGCLSFPGKEILVCRPKNIELTGLDRYGKPVQIKAGGLFARALEHENDHLNSTLLVDHIRQTKIIFIGTGTLGTYALEALARDPQYSVVKVVTGKASAYGRNKQQLSNPILDLAKKLKLPILETDNINSEESIGIIKKTKAKLAVMADFGQIIKPGVLNLFRYGIINIHPSLLPKHRGPSPIQQTILDGDKITGVSLILTVAKMDAGPIISQLKVKLSGAETTSILKDFLAKQGAELLLASLPYYLSGELHPLEQDESKATFSRLFSKTDGEVTKSSHPTEIERKVRAFDCWPGVYTQANNSIVKIKAVHIDHEGNLVIDRVQKEGKNEIGYEEYLRGRNPELTFGG